MEDRIRSTHDPVGVILLVFILSVGIVHQLKLEILPDVITISLLAVLSVIVSLLYYFRVRQLPTSIQSPIGDIFVILSGFYISMSLVLSYIDQAEFSLSWGFLLIILGLMSRVFLFDKFLLYTLHKLENWVRSFLAWIFRSITNTVRIILIIAIAGSLVLIPIWPLSQVLPFTSIFLLSSIFLWIDIVEPRQVKILWRVGMSVPLIVTILSITQNPLQVTVSGTIFSISSLIWIVTFAGFKKAVMALYTIIKAVSDFVIRGLKAISVYVLAYKIRSLQIIFTGIGGLFVVLGILLFDFQLFLYGLISLLIASIPTLPSFINRIAISLYQTVKSIVHIVKTYPKDTFQLSSAILSVLSLIFVPRQNLYGISVRWLTFSIFLLLAILPSIYLRLLHFFKNLVRSVYSAILALTKGLKQLVHWLITSIQAIYRFIIQRPFTTLRIVNGTATPVLLLLGLFTSPMFYYVALVTFIISISPLFYDVIKWTTKVLNKLIKNPDAYFISLTGVSYGLMLWGNLDTVYQIISLSLGTISLSLINHGYLMRIYDRLFLTVFRIINGILKVIYRFLKNWSFPRLLSFTGIMFMLAGIFLPFFVTSSEFRGTVRTALFISGLILWVFADTRRRRIFTKLLAWLRDRIEGMVLWILKNLLVIGFYLVALGFGVLAVTLLFPNSFISTSIGDRFVSFIISLFFFLLSGLTIRQAIVWRDTLLIGPGGRKS